MDFNLNFVTLNVGMSISLAGLPDLVKSENLDVLFLQEVRLTVDQIKNILRGFNAAVNIDENNPDRPGTALVWRNEIVITDIYSIVPCRAQVATLGEYKFMNVYAPSGSDKKYERKIFYGCELFQYLLSDKFPLHMSTLQD